MTPYHIIFNHRTAKFHIALPRLMDGIQVWELSGTPQDSPRLAAIHAIELQLISLCADVKHLLHGATTKEPSCG